MEKQPDISDKIKMIEKISTGREQIAQLIIVLLGLKPATELSIYEWNTKPEEVEEILKSTGLYFSRKEVNKYNKAIAQYAISTNQENVQRLLTDLSPEEYGLLMGYPQSAVEGFINDERYDGPLPLDIENSIFKFVFSEDHFEEEFETIRKWNKALEEFAPDLLT